MLLVNSPTWHSITSCIKTHLFPFLPFLHYPLLSSIATDLAFCYDSPFIWRLWMSSAKGKTPKLGYTFKARRSLPQCKMVYHSLYRDGTQKATADFLLCVCVHTRIVKRSDSVVFSKIFIFQYESFRLHGGMCGLLQGDWISFIMKSNLPEEGNKSSKTLKESH